MQTFLIILCNFLWALGCGYYANKRGHNPTNWFVAGLLFGILALIVLFLLPARKKKEMVQSEPILPILTILQPDHIGKLWYFIDEEKKQLGPMSFDALGKAWQEGKVREKTYVWNEAMENWREFQDVIKSAPILKTSAQ